MRAAQLGSVARARTALAPLVREADLIADTPDTLDPNRGWTPVLRSLQSMSVVSPAPPQAPPPSSAVTPTSQGRAGLYLAQVNRMYLRPNFGGGGGMTTDYRVDTEF